LSGRGCPDCTRRSASSRPRRRGGWSAALLLLAGGLGIAHWQGRLPVLSNTIRVEPAPAPAPRVDLRDVQAHERFAQALTALLADGRRELMTVGEPYAGAAAGSAAETRLARDWAESFWGWEQRVSRACAMAPAAPAQGGDLRVVMAHQQLGDACHQLRLATEAPGEAVPMNSQRQASLDQAAARIAEARAQLEGAARY
jgi:hypothetical protein